MVGRIRVVNADCGTFMEPKCPVTRRFATVYLQPIADGVTHLAASYCGEKDCFNLLMNFHFLLKQLDAVFKLGKLASHSEDQLPEILLVHFCQGISD